MHPMKNNFFNPFYKNNPYYVASKFYSDDVRKDKITHGQQSLKYSSSQSSINSTKYSYNNQYSNNDNLTHNFYSNVIQTKENTLKKKAINKNHNPFNRKNLLQPTNVTVKDNQFHPQQISTNNIKLRTRTSAKDQLLVDNLNKIQIQKASLSTMYRKSQQSLKRVSCQLISQRKSIKELYSKKDLQFKTDIKQPQTITIKGTIFYLQNIL